MMKKLFFLLVVVICFESTIKAQADRWQQRIKYQIDVDVNVATNQFSGTEKIEYINNSPDTLKRVFFHMYWNAFQPNSMMDVRSRELGQTILGTNRRGEPLLDWDSRVRDRIFHLNENEIGYQKARKILVNGKEQKLIEHETILEVVLDKPILPKSKTNLLVYFEAQVPLQVRRSGRDNAEGVRYSMSQWYPKMVEYDYQGWNANPYIAREFYGVWGDYNVNISIDKSYMIASTGTLQNTNKIGFGYEAKNEKVIQPKTEKLTWNFVANNVHDFVWAADPTYKMIKQQITNGPLIYVIYKANPEMENRWQKMMDTMVLAYPIIAKTFGEYPYKNYTFIQGGDGGMEYPMATLIKNASVGTALHEWMHTWFQMLMGTNESLYPWMDEGFASYADSRVLNTLRGSTNFWFKGEYEGYFGLVKSGLEEPASTHSDHYNTNSAYGRAAYSKGAVFMEQLGYIVGAEVRDQILLDYYNQWKFKHPNPNDLIRVAERRSNIELQWYKEYWINSTKSIDYAIDSLWEDAGKTKIRIRRIGKMPMPIDFEIRFKDGSKESHYAPLDLMYGAKNENPDVKIYSEWKWTHPTYVFETEKKLFDILEVEIDPSQRLADVDKRNNLLKIKW